MRISRKLRAMMMATASVALLLAFGGFLTVDFFTLRDRIERDLTTLGDVIASNSTAPLTFGDREAATEILAALRAKPSVMTAVLYTRLGDPFASYSAGGARFTPSPLQELRLPDGTGSIGVLRPVVLGGERIGTLCIVATNNTTVKRAWEYAMLVGGIVILSLIAAFILSSRLERLLSSPIGELARVAAEITRNRNYAVRVDVAVAAPHNEIGELIVAFNQMLAEIERHDDELEEQVQRRTRELQAANARLLAARDAAERVAATNAELSLRKQMILNSAAEGIFGLDASGIATFVNPSAAQILGIPREQLVGARLHDILHPSDENAPIDDCNVCSAALTPGIRAGKRDTFIHRSGREIPVEYTAATILDGPGRPCGVVVTFRDITERLAIDRMKDEFVSTVSHELRTPLTSIRGSLGLLGSGLLGPLGDRAQRMLDVAVANTDRLVRLINDILDLERIHNGTIELNRSDVDAADLMTESVEGIQSFADRAGVQIEVEPLHEIVCVDRDRIVQTLTNLLSNSIKFSTPGTTVRLFASGGADVLTFAVADQGRGIPATHVESIFERFKQVDASDSRARGGTGLGLAICRSIVAAHGGRIWAESVEGIGSTFRFTIPLREVADAA